MLLRVSTTMVESYRLLCTQPWMGEADLTETVRGEFKGNERTRCGSAFHSILESPTTYLVAGDSPHFAADGRRPEDPAAEPFRFRIEDVMAGLEGIPAGGTFEVKETRTVSHFSIVGPVQVQVVAKVDHVTGTHVREHKTKYTAFDIDRYFESYQWRAYLWVFGASRVEYAVHRFKGEPTTEKPMVLNGIETFRFYPYGGLDGDCRRWATEFVDWAIGRRLTRFLLPKKTPDAISP